MIFPVIQPTIRPMNLATSDLATPKQEVIGGIIGAIVGGVNNARSSFRRTRRHDLHRYRGCVWCGNPHPDCPAD